MTHLLRPLTTGTFKKPTYWNETYAASASMATTWNRLIFYMLDFLAKASHKQARVLGLTIREDSYFMKFLG